MGETSFKSVFNGSWCPICANQAKMRGTIDEAKLLAHSKNGVCLSKQMQCTSSRLQWKCSEGHQWETTFNIVKQGHWCPYCARNASRLTLNDAKKLAQTRGGDCLSDTYVSLKKNLIWQCSKGHQWQANYSNVRSGTWCPICSRRKNQAECHEIFVSLFPSENFRQEVIS